MKTGPAKKPTKKPVKKAAKKKAPKKKHGRPDLYTEEVAAKILHLISTTAKGLSSICKSDKSLPSDETVRKWINEDREGFLGRYTRAREEQADLLAEEIVGISDEVSRKKALSHEAVAAARLRMDARKWVASKLKPKKYGDKIDHTTDGESLNKGFFDYLKQTSGNAGSQG
ncbi:hypothetical protein [Flavihumibacter petaseus]|uniref:Terminase small subunit n=1 Tax=Flavihumibacter petaseus NBRC 106054 TaxID=1220578 RepID=A0A0E9N343_9BACT|nr:hypothetical protein [Flavihumibacter petaseus]GAO43780.1 hypothetical protein FPE01S_02_08860 [Flavihumibacter petaseus NBRC 106054]